MYRRLVSRRLHSRIRLLSGSDGDTPINPVFFNHAIFQSHNDRIRICLSANLAAKGGTNRQAEIGEEPAAMTEGR